MRSAAEFPELCLVYPVIRLLSVLKIAELSCEAKFHDGSRHHHARLPETQLKHSCFSASSALGMCRTSTTVTHHLNPSQVLSSG